MSESSLVERLRAQREVHLKRPRVIRAGFVVAGFTLLFAGMAMLVLPGPAFVVIPVALAILSLEFAWAGRLLEKALVQAEKAKSSAAQTSRAQRVAVGVAMGIAVVAAIMASVLWEIPVVPYT
jgi:uncharacterized protein (TIGR02611 family)